MYSDEGILPPTYLCFKCVYVLLTLNMFNTTCYEITYQIKNHMQIRIKNLLNKEQVNCNKKCTIDMHSKHIVSPYGNKIDIVGYNYPIGG